MKFKYIFKAVAAALSLVLVISAVGASPEEPWADDGISENLQEVQTADNTDLSQLNDDENGDESIQEPAVPEKIPEAIPELPPQNVTKQPEEPTEAESTDEADTKQNEKLLDVPYINQRTYFPNGCESVSAVMALQYAGVDISAGDFIRDYLDMGSAPRYSGGRLIACDPRKEFPGDPRSKGGWGCYPEVIKAAIDKMELESLEAVILKDVAISALCSEYIDNDIPVVFWGTIDMNRPSSWVSWTVEGTDKTHTWTSPFHCLLLVGYDDEYYYFNDPWRQKNSRYSKADVERAYTGIGREALVIVEK